MHHLNDSPPDHAGIRKVVKEFYALTRAHPELGPVFAAHVTDWDSHEEKIVDFWCGALLRQPGYAGNPMQKHLAAGNVLPAHFPVWLTLFDTVLNRHLPEQQAVYWSTLAHRIGKSLSYGLEYTGRETATTPPGLSSYPRLK
ncbi:MAG: group III truncated hemoglobin [Sulfitobacter sp.]